MALDTYVWTYSPTRQVHTPRHIQTGNFGINGGSYYKLDTNVNLVLPKHVETVNGQVKCLTAG